MTATFLCGIAGVVISLLAEFVPGLSTWYNKLTDTWQRLTMLAVVVVVAAAIFGLSCGSVVTYVTCDKAGIISLLTAIGTALVTNQVTFVITPKS